MTIQLKNVGKVCEASIKLEGVTVIAGQNSTGKTTIAKAIHSTLSPLKDLQQRIKHERMRSVRRLLALWFDAVTTQYLHSTEGRERFFYEKRMYRDRQEFIQDVLSLYKDELATIPCQWEFTHEMLLPLVKPFTSNEVPGVTICVAGEIDLVLNRTNEALARDDAAYLKFILEQSFAESFDGQVNAVDTDQQAFIDTGLVSFAFASGNIVDLAYDPSVFNVDDEVTFIKSYRDCGLDKQPLIMRAQHSDIQRKLLHEGHGATTEPETIEEHQERKLSIDKVRQCIDGIVHGHLDLQDDVFQFIEDEHPLLRIKMKNVASGVIPFVIIERLVENGTLKRGSLLIIDEPEMNLHPQWQVDCADLLVCLQQKAGINSLLISHSPYFIRAVDRALLKASGVPHAMYLMVAQGKRYKAEEVTDTPDQIFKELYAPFERL